MTKRKVTAKKNIEEGDSKKQKREKDVSIYKILVKCNNNYLFHIQQATRKRNKRANESTEQRTARLKSNVSNSPYK